MTDKNPTLYSAFGLLSVESVWNNSDGTDNRRQSAIDKYSINAFSGAATRKRLNSYINSLGSGDPNATGSVGEQVLGFPTEFADAQGYYNLFPLNITSISTSSGVSFGDGNFSVSFTLDHLLLAVDKFDLEDELKGYGKYLNSYSGKKGLTRDVTPFSVGAKGIAANVEDIRGGGFVWLDFFAGQKSSASITRLTGSEQIANNGERGLARYRINNANTYFSIDDLVTPMDTVTIWLYNDPKDFTVSDSAKLSKDGTPEISEFKHIIGSGNRSGQYTQTDEEVQDSIFGLTGDFDRILESAIDQKLGDDGDFQPDTLEFSGGDLNAAVRSIFFRGISWVSRESYTDTGKKDKNGKPITPDGLDAPVLESALLPDGGDLVSKARSVDSVAINKVLNYLYETQGYAGGVQYANNGNGKYNKLAGTNPELGFFIANIINNPDERLAGAKTPGEVKALGGRVELKDITPHIAAEGGSLADAVRAQEAAADSARIANTGTPAGVAQDVGEVSGPLASASTQNALSQQMRGYDPPFQAAYICAEYVSQTIRKFIDPRIKYNAAALNVIEQVKNAGWKLVRSRITNNNPINKTYAQVGDVVIFTVREAGPEATKFLPTGHHIVLIGDFDKVTGDAIYFEGETDDSGRRYIRRTIGYPPSSAVWAEVYRAPGMIAKGATVTQPASAPVAKPPAAGTRPVAQTPVKKTQNTDPVVAASQGLGQFQPAATPTPGDPASIAAQSLANRGAATAATPAAGSAATPGVQEKDLTDGTTGMYTFKNKEAAFLQGRKQFEILMQQYAKKLHAERKAVSTEEFLAVSSATKGKTKDSPIHNRTLAVTRLHSDTPYCVFKGHVTSISTSVSPGGAFSVTLKGAGLDYPQVKHKVWYDQLSFDGRIGPGAEFMTAYSALSPAKSVIHLISSWTPKTIALNSSVRMNDGQQLQAPKVTSKGSLLRGNIIYKAWGNHYDYLYKDKNIIESAETYQKIKTAVGKDVAEKTAATTDLRLYTPVTYLDLYRIPEFDRALIKADPTGSIASNLTPITVETGTVAENIQKLAGPNQLYEIFTNPLGKVVYRSTHEAWERTPRPDYTPTLEDQEIESGNFTRDDSSTLTLVDVNPTAINAILGAVNSFTALAYGRAMPPKRPLPIEFIASVKGSTQVLANGEATSTELSRYGNRYLNIGDVYGGLNQIASSKANSVLKYFIAPMKRAEISVEQNSAYKPGETVLLNLKSHPKRSNAIINVNFWVAAIQVLPSAQYIGVDHRIFAGLRNKDYSLTNTEAGTNVLFATPRKKLEISETKATEFVRNAYAVTFAWLKSQGIQNIAAEYWPTTLWFYLTEGKPFKASDGPIPAAEVISFYALVMTAVPNNKAINARIAKRPTLVETLRFQNWRVESYYIENVSHSLEYGVSAGTRLSLSFGQVNILIEDPKRNIALGHLSLERKHFVGFAAQDAWLKLYSTQFGEDAQYKTGSFYYRASAVRNSGIYLYKALKRYFHPDSQYFNQKAKEK